MAKEPYEILPDEFNCEISDSEERSEQITKKRKRRTRRVFRMFSYIFSSVLMVTAVTGEIPFTETPVISQNTDSTAVFMPAESIIEDEQVDSALNAEAVSADANEQGSPASYAEEAQNEDILCDLCEGTGIICPGDPDFGFDRGNGHGYEGCHGTGYSPCPDIWCRGSYKICQNCKGGGTVNGIIDEVCGGDGIVDCEFCHNTGTAECITADLHETCEKCQGTGKLN